jgi:hypothetical protein
MGIFYVFVGAFWLRVTGTFLYAFDGTEFSMDFFILILWLANSKLKGLHLGAVRKRWTFTLNETRDGTEFPVDVFGLVNSLAEIGVWAILSQGWTFRDSRTFTFITTADWALVAVDDLILIVRFADSGVPPILPATFGSRRTTTDIRTRHCTSLSMKVLVFEYWATESFVSNGINVLRALWKRWTSAFEVASDGTSLTIEIFIGIDG